MQPLNPFLAAFFKPGNPIISQCTPVHHHILLVPTTEFLLTSRETESGQSSADLIGSEEFLGSHVLRVPSPATAAGGKDAVGNLREVRGKARQYSTLNGRSVVIKDAAVFSNKGFKTLAQALLQGDSIWYADTIEPRQWLVYYISRPLVGNWEEIPVEPAVFTEGLAKKKRDEANRESAIENGEPSLPRKKEIKNFHDLLNHFPIIARQMHPGLEKLFREFTIVFQKPLPPPPSAANIPDPMPDGPIATAMRKVRSNSVSARRASTNGEGGSSQGTENFFAEDDEDVMRASLETAVTSAIDLFQSVDKQQLSMLGATTDLTGPLVERLIERYVAENVHSFLWPRLTAMRRQDDLELEAKIRPMEFIDISQLGISIDGGLKGKQDLTTRLETAINEFRKMTSALCPQDMMESLLSTMKAATQLAEQSRPDMENGTTSEKPILTINADSLVSLFLHIIIRANNNPEDEPPIKRPKKVAMDIRNFVMTSAAEPQIKTYFALQDSRGRSVAHYLFHAPALIARIGKLVHWRQKDKNGQTPLFALCRSYDHTYYHNMVEAGLAAATEAQGDGQPLHLDEHVDSKGNTLLHIINDHQLALQILRHCDVDVNATNERKFTALMVASKYGRFDMVRALYSDQRVDIAAKELRGLTAVELAKDDDVRNKIDDLTLFTMPAAADSRVTGVVRSFFVEDATIRLVLKSGAPADSTSYTVTTSRRSMADFERLTNLLAIENPASWIPNISNQRSPFQIPSKPSRAVLKDIQLRTNSFIGILLTHPTFATHEMLWEFFLVPDLQGDMLEQRSRLKAETRAEKVREEYEPLEDTREVEQFVDHAREMVRGVNYATKSVARRVNSVGVASVGKYQT
ncbi:putative vps9 domain protein [Eutypa lata UCREL1]|uniref:Putative vps9 domain protein n=1 Tax=Eutypa lata (strain UCR-EL1) TaxID=1287681 RepID=M7SGV1_EUTLA|nr:putative vps9 domain protein [Eutypa lata UCREL1]